MESSSDSEEGYLYPITSPLVRQPMTTVTVAGHIFKVLVDSLATINVIDSDTYSKLNAVKLLRTKTKAYPYNSQQPVNFLGKFEAIIETSKKYTISNIYVVADRNSGCLLSLYTAQELGLIKLQLDSLEQKHPSLSRILND